jgi:protein-tyrosine phosphatase
MLGRVDNGPQQELLPRVMPLGGWDPARVRSRFGTYRGLVRLTLAWIENVAGNYHRFKQIRWDGVKRVVFVCHGNICRSPYAERRAAIHGLPAASFGLSAERGAPADPTGRRIAERRAVELAAHCACDVGEFEFRSGDLLVAMEPRQARILLRGMPSVPCQLTLLGLWSRPPRPHIHDPHRLSDAYWEHCFAAIDSAVRTISDHIGSSRPNGG